MRVWLVILLLLPVAVLADGFAAKGYMPTLRETDQSAVIRLEPGRATVDMYIGIAGIPKGKTITYILPFWYKPEGFRLAEMEAGTYQQRYANPAIRQVGEMNSLATSAAGDAFSACVMTGTVLTGPVSLALWPVFAKAREKARQGGVAGALLPYATTTTPHARAELYEIGKDDLQTLVAQAGLPAKHAAPLKKYHTRFFAVMRLTGLGIDPKDRKAMLRGVHYHFTHPLTGSEYTYPLGTGAAWPQSITATQVYITCPEDYELAVDAPREGIWTEMFWLSMWVRDYREFEEVESTEKQRNEVLSDINMYQYNALDSNPNTPEDTRQMHQLAQSSHVIYPATASALHGGIRHTSAWHIAYFHSNPSRDIYVRMTRRSNGWMLALGHFFNIDIVPYAFALGILLLSCCLAARLTLHRHWVAANKPCRFVWFGTQAYLQVLLVMSMSTGIVLGAGFILFAAGDMGHISTGVLAFLLAFCCALLWRMLARKPIGRLLNKNTLAGLWITAVVIYVALSVGFIAFVNWTGTALTG